MNAAVDFSKLFAQGELAGIQAACSISPSAPSANVEPTNEPLRVAGQNAPEPQRAEAQNTELGGMAAIVKNLSERAAAEAENMALNASEAAPEALSNGSEFTPANSPTPNLDNAINKILFGKQGEDCSLDDVACQSVGAKPAAPAFSRAI